MVPPLFSGRQSISVREQCDLMLPVYPDVPDLDDKANIRNYDFDESQTGL